MAQSTTQPFELNMVSPDNCLACMADNRELTLSTADSAVVIAALVSLLMLRKVPMNFCMEHADSFFAVLRAMGCTLHGKTIDLTEGALPS